MKTQAEMYQALLDGKTLVHKSGTKVKLAEGKLVDENNKPIVSHEKPEEWLIDEPKVTITRKEFDAAFLYVFGIRNNDTSQENLAKRLGL